jgi:hypothetical protein
MSSYTSRPRVKSVSVSPLVTGGAVLAAKALSSVISACMAGAAEALEIVQDSWDSETIPTKIVAPHQATSQQSLRLRQLLTEVDSTPLTQTEKIKLSTVAQLSVSNRLVEVTPDYQKLMDSLANAQTSASAQQAARDLVMESDRAHENLFNTALLSRVEQALVSAGFADVSKQQGTGKEPIRVVGTDEKGRSIVTEISKHEGETNMQYEVVGVTDNSCKKLMDTFDEALDRAGLRSDTPRRKFTGGISVLPAAKELAVRKMKKYTAPLSKPETFTKKENKNAQKIRSRTTQLIQSRSS